MHRNIPRHLSFLSCLIDTLQCCILKHFFAPPNTGTFIEDKNEGRFIDHSTLRHCGSAQHRCAFPTSASIMIHNTAKGLFIFQTSEWKLIVHTYVVQPETLSNLKNSLYFSDPINSTQTALEIVAIVSNFNTAPTFELFPSVEADSFVMKAAANFFRGHQLNRWKPPLSMKSMKVHSLGYFTFSDLFETRDLLYFFSFMQAISLKPLESLRVCVIPVSIEFFKFFLVITEVICSFEIIGVDVNNDYLLERIFSPMNNTIYSGPPTITKKIFF